MPKKTHNSTDIEVTWWKLAAKTAPFVAMVGMGICYLLAEHLIIFYIGAVVLIWTLVSVAWWWWAIEKILKVSRMMLNTNVAFEEVKKELKALKNDVGNRQRRE